MRFSLDPTVDGMKTGFTENAGYCLITSAISGGERRLAFSGIRQPRPKAARVTESQKPLNFGFQYYDSVKRYTRGNQPITGLRVLERRR